MGLVRNLALAPIYSWLKGPMRAGWTVLAPTAHEHAPDPEHNHVRDPWALCHAARLLWSLALDPVVLPHVASPDAVAPLSPWTDGNVFVLGRFEGWAAPWSPQYAFLDRRVRGLPRMTRFLDPFSLAIPSYRRILRRSNPPAPGTEVTAHAVDEVDVGVVSIHEHSDGTLTVAAQGGGYHGTIGAVKALVSPETFAKVVPPEGVHLPLEFVVVTRVRHSLQAECGDVLDNHDVFVGAEIDQFLGRPPRGDGHPYVFTPAPGALHCAPLKFARLESTADRMNYGEDPVHVVLDDFPAELDWARRRHWSFSRADQEERYAHRRLTDYFRRRYARSRPVENICVVQMVEILDYLFENAQVRGFPESGADLGALGFIRLGEVALDLWEVLSPLKDLRKLGAEVDRRRRTGRGHYTDDELKRFEKLGLGRLRKNLLQPLESLIESFDDAFRDASFDGRYAIWMIRDYTGRVGGGFGPTWIGVNVSRYEGFKTAAQQVRAVARGEAAALRRQVGRR